MLLKLIIALLDQKPFELGLPSIYDLDLPIAQFPGCLELPFGSSMKSQHLPFVIPELEDVLQTGTTGGAVSSWADHTFVAEKPDPTLHQFVPPVPAEQVTEAWAGVNAGAGFVLPQYSKLVAPITASFDGADPTYDQQLQAQEQRRRERKIKNRASAARSRARRVAYISELECQIKACKAENGKLEKRTDAVSKSWNKFMAENPSPKKFKIVRSNSL